MSTSKWNSVFVKELIVKLREMEAFDRGNNLKRAEMLSEILQFKVGVCEECSRPLIPRRLWDMIPTDQRSHVVARAGSTNMCFHHHRTKTEQLPSKPMTKSEIDRLRKAVGLS